MYLFYIFGYCNLSVLQYTLTVVFTWNGYPIYLMNVHHGLSLSLFDEHQISFIVKGSETRKMVNCMRGKHIRSCQFGEE